MHHMKTAIKKVTQKFQRMFDPYPLVYHADTHVYIVYSPTFNVQMKKERLRLTRSSLSTSNSAP